MSLRIKSENLTFGGRQIVFTHDAASVSCSMTGAIFLPSRAMQEPVPVIYYLSGLTCTEQNVITKAGAQRYCQDHAVALVCPDTSPRGAEVPDQDADDLGTGAGFYVNATHQPWSKHYRMYDYVTQELPQFIEAEFPVNQRRSIMGHSMGGHGALMIALKNPQRYRAVSAFSPVVAPSQVPWGQKALSAYLGEDPEAWAQYDTVRLLQAGAKVDGEILVDVGTADPFLEKQLRPELLQVAAQTAGQALRLRRQPGYDHSYYFIASFMGEHIAHHATCLGS